MLKSGLIIAGLVLFTGQAGAQVIVSCDAEHNVPSNVGAELDAVLTKMVDPASGLASIVGYAPGGVLSVRSADWRYARSAGTADPDHVSPMSCDTPFQIGSNTKMITATVLMQLKEEGVLTLDDLLSRHLPGFAEALPNGDLLTLRQLANHTAGVFSYTDNAPDGTPGIMEGDLADPDALRRGYTMEELVAFAAEHGQPTFFPGAEGQWAYSNTGYILLGLVIEKIEGRPLGQSFDARIFEPLGLKDTSYVDGVPGPELGLPRAYFGAPFDIETTDWNMSQGAAAGAVVSTADDMHVFIEALLAGNLFALETSLAEMQETVTTSSGTIPNYGIGLAQKAEGVWGHGGQTLGFESDIAFFEEPSLSMVGWASSANNIMVIGVSAVSKALMNTGVLPDPSAALEAELIGKMTGSEWQLVSIQSGDGDPLQPANPEDYTIAFDAAGSFAAQADCNRVLGDWSLENQKLTIEAGPTTLAACPPESLSETFIQWLFAAGGASIAEDGTLLVFAVQDEKFGQLLFALKQ
ncbi:serine hydrolase [Aliisedimentitalea scapharcae]|uniref:Serine hydrolase n=1 Tax=Aliisedimentitalea scapharcae TaxID=1524259 RepID=A0ABZ2XMI2_9RHOB